MTTVVIDYMARKVYTDTRCTGTQVIGNFPFRKKVEVFSDTFHKFWRMRNFCYAASGNVEEIEKFIHSHISGKPWKLKASEVIVLDTNSSRATGFSCRGVEDCSTYHHTCLGSGAKVALGRLYANFTPEEAIISASHEDPYTSSEVKVYDY